MRPIAWLFAICTMTAAACSFDTSGAPSGGAADPDASVTLPVTPDAAVAADARPTPPDACAGKKCDGDKGPGGH